MNLKKMLAILTALCLALGSVGALAGGMDMLGDLLQAYVAEGEASEPTEGAEEAAEPTEGGEAAAEAPAEPDPDIDEEYVFGAEEEEEIVVDELIEVDDYAITEGLSEDWLNILLLGTDARGTNKYSRTDTMIVLSVNPATGEAKLSSIMRDIWVSLPNHAGAKLNAACVYGGPELTMRTINEYFHLNIQYYALVNMRCLVAIVDDLGGIRMEITNHERRSMNALIASDAKSEDASNHAFATSMVKSAGDVLLNGKQALAFVRIRKSDSDYARTERQRKLLTTVMHQLQQENLLSLAGILTDMLEYVETNLTFEEILTLATMAMSMDAEDVSQFRIPVDDTYEAGMYGTTWCIKPDFEENARQLHEFIYG